MTGIAHASGILTMRELPPDLMSESEWMISIPSGNWVITHRGIRIMITRSGTGEPIEIGWFIGGQVVESVPLSCDLEWAKKLAVDVVDGRIPEDEEWMQAEKRDGEWP